MRRAILSVIAVMTVLTVMLVVGTAVGKGLQPQQATASSMNALAIGSAGKSIYTRKLPPTPGSVKPSSPDPNYHPTACLAPVTNISQRAGNEAETFVVLNPTNANNIVAFSNLETENSIFRSYSTDGGTTWTHGTVATGAACCDGQATFDSFGNLFLVYIDGTVSNVNVILSTDGGATFSAPVTAGSGSIDQPSIAVGNGSLWVDWNSGGSMVARGAPVTGLGAWGPFNAQQTIPSATGSFGGITVGPGPNGGKVMVTYMNPTGGEGPATIYANVDADGLGAGGFGPQITVTTTNVGGFDYIPAQSGRSIDAEAGLVWDSTGGPFNGRVYLVYTEEPVNESNDTEIYLRTSTDDGTTWTAPVRVNDDPMGPIRSQFLPYIAMDNTTGTVAIGWYDARNDDGVPGSGGTNNIPNDDAEYYASYSTDGGITWAANQLISGGFSNAADAGSGVDYGDYIGDVAAHGGHFYMVWADNTNCDGTNADGTLHQFDLYMGVMNLPSLGTPTPTLTGTPPTATRTLTPSNTPTATPTVCGAQAPYAMATSTGATIVPGTTDTGNHCDDCLTTITLPFTYQLYDQNFTSAQVSSNGQLDFGTGDAAFTNTCLPDTAATYAIFPHWDDLYTVNSGYGVFTSISGTAPNRIFNIEWRDQYFPGTGTANFEVRLYEGQKRFDVIYGQVDQGGSSATVGVERNNGDSNFTQFECNTGGITSGLMLTFTQATCATPTTGPTSTSTFTNTPVPPTSTNTPLATDTPVATDTPEATDTPVPTDTSTDTNTPVPTNTSVPTDTNTPVPPTATPTACTLSFSDVPSGSTFYQFIRCLACKGIINGYPDGTFRPGNNVTRGQLSKIVSNSAGFSDTPTGQQYQDVPPTGPDSTFYVYIYRLSSRGYINGYPCGAPPAGACVPPGNLPYFLPNANSTRGQISKIVSNAAGFHDNPVGQQFQDVPVNSPFYAYIYRLVSRGVMSGYPCGTPPAGPCVPPGNLPYFRPNNNATRGQTSKIVANTFFPNCNPPDAAKQ